MASDVLPVAMFCICICQQPAQPSASGCPQLLQFLHDWQPTSCPPPCPVPPLLPHSASTSQEICFAVQCFLGGRVRNYPRCPIPVAKIFQTSGRTIEEKLWAGMKIPYSLVGPVLPNTEELISRPLLGLLKDPIAAPGPYENQEC